MMGGSACNEACSVRERVFRMALAGVMLAFLSIAHPLSAFGVSSCRSRDEIWLVSQRHTGCLESEESPALRTWRYEPGTGWSDRELADIFEPASGEQIFLIYVHGNRVSPGEAACQGRHVHRVIASQVDNPASVRYIIWSWPSSRISGQLRDFRVKARRTELAGYCLGWFLAHVPARQRISLLGYSYGARIATGALHVRGGGGLAGRTLPAGESCGHDARVVLLAAALHRNWLRPRCYHHQALKNTDHLLNLYNSCDAILKRYQLLYKCSRPEALGYTGMSLAGLGAERERIKQCDVRRVVGKSHALARYLQSYCLRDKMQRVLFWQSIP